MTWVGLAAVCACAGRQAPAPAETYDRAAGLATFDAAWRIVHQTHFDTAFNGVDWVAQRDRWRPLAEGATDTETLRGVIARMLERLGQSHFSLIPREAAGALNPDDADPSPDTAATSSGGLGDVGIDTRLIGDELVVTAVEPGGPAALAGIQSGWTLLSIEGQSTAQLLSRIRETEVRRSPALVLWSAAQARLAGPVGSPCDLTVRDPAGAERTVRLERQAMAGQEVRFGSLPAFHARFASREVRTPGGRAAGVVWFNFWMVPLIRQVDSAVNAYRGFDGIVVDLRGNRGGLALMIVGVAGHFFEQRDTLGTVKMRGNSLRLIANPRRVNPGGERVTPFGGPVAVLLDEGSASASEVFAGGLQSLGRVRVFGARSAGAVLPALWDRLPNGDVLYHAIAEFVTQSGEHLEGVGVTPDEAVVVTRQDLISGRDPVLATALAWIDRNAHDTPD